MCLAPSLRSDSDSELSPSDSEEDEEEKDKNESETLERERKSKKDEKENVKAPRTPSRSSSAALYKTPAKKTKNAPEQPSLVEEYFEAHGSSKVLTSDRTLQKLSTPKLDRVGLGQFQNIIWHFYLQILDP